eukprot:5795439-Prymnesium_polylepis.1
MAIAEVLDVGQVPMLEENFVLVQGGLMVCGGRRVNQERHAFTEIVCRVDAYLRAVLRRWWRKWRRNRWRR